MKRIIALIALLSFWLPAALRAQDEVVLEDWATRWSELETSEALSGPERLVRQTELLSEAGAGNGWRDEQVWQWTVQVLNGWERSSSVEAAYEAYTDLLDRIGQAAGLSAEPLPDESALREYYQRALGIVRTPAEEGRLLFYIAQSLQRTSPDTYEARRRIEAYLQQAALSLADNPPMDAVQFSLAELYRQWSSASEATADGGESYLSRAVFHYRYIQGMSTARESYRQAADAALEELLRPGLELSIPNRFLPENDIRISLRTLNLQQVEVSVYSLPWEENGIPVSYQRLQEDAEMAEVIPETLLFTRKFSVQPRHRFDWNQTELRLGENFAGGWYWISVKAGGLEACDLMLVTSLELVMIPRPDNSLTLWAVDVESGTPVANAIYHLLDESGEVLLNGTCDTNGLAMIRVPEGQSWAEIHVQDGASPGVLLAANLKVSAGRKPWVLPGPADPVAGGALQFAMMDGQLTGEEASAVRVLYPDGSAQEVEVAMPADEVRMGSVPVAESEPVSGPVFLEMPAGEEVLLGNLRAPGELPVRLNFTGERFDPQTNLFLSTTPVGVRARSGGGPAAAVPDYVRVRVVPVDRTGIDDKGTVGPNSVAPVFESILNCSQADNRTAYFEIPEMAASAGVQVLRVEVFPLESDELLGQSYLAILPYRTLVNLRTNEHLVKVGDTVQVDLSYSRANDASARSLEGELVIFRETWESRYIHRKRGTLLSEADYRQLPDRSLLGSAKTDYRLLEQGFIREEIERIPVDLAEQEQIPITLDRTGYYHIEFDGRELETQPNYPEGPLEIWVIPGELDLRAFRSEDPRLITEAGPDGRQQILILIDRQDSGVLLDLEMEDGSHVTRVLDPASPALYLDEALPAGARLSVCRAVIVGERESDILCRHLPLQDHVEWNLNVDRSVGFNPGAEINWNLALEEGQTASASVWAFYLEERARSVTRLLEEQRKQVMERLHDADEEILSLGSTRPVYHPFVEGLNSRPDTDSGEENRYPDPEQILALFPEMRRNARGPVSGLDLRLAVPASTEGSISLSGTLPETAGRWSLLVFSLLREGQLNWQSWPLSTELPIRTTLSGPALLRQGDSATAILSLENTTRGQERLQIEFEVDGALSADLQVPISRNLARGQRETVPAAIRASSAGSGRINAIATGRSSTSEAAHSMVVEPDPSYAVLRTFVVQPGSADWSRNASLAGWQDVRLTVSSGLAGFLDELWNVLREKLGPEPLLQVLGDWARERTRGHLGIHSELQSDSLAALIEELQHYSAGGGWAWTPGHDPDPWLTSLVLWTLETFSTLSDNGLDTFRQEARDYLEEVLIDEDVALDARLYALHALAAPAYNDPRTRPSRIQARSFLNFLHDRAQLSHAGFAILAQVARAYRFNEEVGLLVGELRERVRTRGIPMESGFWSRSLVYLALGEIRTAEALRNQVLQGAVENLSTVGTRRSWLQAGGYLNMLAVFYWEGDFNVEGTARLSTDGEEAVTVSLRPDGPQQGRYAASLEGDREHEIRLNTVDARGPVFLTLSGRTAQQPDWPLYPEQSEEFFREYVESTLLAGEHRELEEFSMDSALRAGDSLQVFLTLYLEEAKPFGELHFSIPAGASLGPDAIQHSFEPSSSEAIFDPPQMEPVEQGDPLQQVMRMEPLAPGRHEFILSYRMDWPGTYRFPAHRLYIPRTGEIFQLGEDWELRIEAP